MPDQNNNNQVIIEYHSVGHMVKVSAIDPVSLTEVSIVGPANARKQELAELVMQKLRYVLQKKNPS